LTVAFYISGHGFGHASRQIEILNAFAARRPDVRLILRTSAARWLFDRTLQPPFLLIDGRCDTGVIQIDSLRLDIAATIDTARSFYGTFDRRAAEEATLLREYDVTFVVADAPPLGCAAAAAAGIRSVVVSNFTWDWIYEEYAEYLPAAPEVIPAIRRAYAQAECAWRLPVHGGFESFRTVVDVPFVARHARHGRDETRAAFGLPAARPIALVSFGGYGVERLDLRQLDCLEEWAILTTDDQQPHAPLGVHAVNNHDIYDRGFRYEDLVRAADVVMTKPGYGIVSECLANDAAVVYTSRGRFAEYPIMVTAMPRFLRCAEISHDDLFAGRWLDALNRAIGAAPPPTRPATNGAEVIADMIVGALDGR
jgi:L-arabinokinase